MKRPEYENELQARRRWNAMTAGPEQCVPWVWARPDQLAVAVKAPFLCRIEPEQRDDLVPLYGRAALALKDAEIEKLRAALLEAHKEKAGAFLQAPASGRAAHSVSSEKGDDSHTHIGCTAVLADAPGPNVGDERTTTARPNDGK